MSHSAPQSGYIARSRRPLQALYFLLPLLLAYEAGMALYARSAQGNPVYYVKAWTLLRRLLQPMGETGFYITAFLPGLLVVVVLFCLHVAHRDPWKISTRTALWMWGESALLPLPLLVLALVLLSTPAASRAPMAAQAVQPLPAPAAPAADPAPGHIPANPPASDGPAPAPPGSPESPDTPEPQATPLSWQAELILDLGAGIYEELLFRLIGIALLHLLLRDFLALPESWAAAGAVIGSALAFAAFHPQFYPLNLAKSLFYIAAGIYFAWIYVQRGFGIVAATHALYDIYATVLKHDLLRW